MLLVFETITWKPHVETAVEIALRELDAGREVVYCNLREGLPTCEDGAAVHMLLDLPRTRQRRARQILVEHGVSCLSPGYDKRQVHKAMADAQSLIRDCANVDQFKKLSYKEYFDIGWAALSSAVSIRRNSSVSPTSDRRLLTRYLAASILVYEKSLEVISKEHPSEVLVFNGRFATTRASLRAAEALNVPWKIHERGADKDHFWIADFMPHDVDRVQQLIVSQWTADRSDAGHRFFRARRARIERDWHSHTRLQHIGRLPEPMQDGGDWVTFFTSSDDEMFAIGDRFESDRFPSQLEAIKKLAAAVAATPSLRLCVRVHPHVRLKSKSDRLKWSLLDIPGALMVAADDTTDSYALIDRSKAVCTYGSTVGVEATYWGRPSLLFSRAFYDQLGVVTLAMDDEQIRAFLRAPVALPPERTLPYGAFWELLGDSFRYYRADSLHGGTICGVNLDSQPIIQAARKVVSMFRPSPY